MKRYAYLTPGEDGNPFTWLAQDELEEFLNDPEGWANITKFVSEDRLEIEECPQEWAEGEGMLIEVKILRPVSRTTAWKLKGE